MNVNDLRIAVTVVSLLVFLGLLAWVWAGHRRPAFEQAARIPFDDEPEVPAP